VIISATHFFILFKDLGFVFDDSLISASGTATQFDFSNSKHEEFFEYCSRYMFLLEKSFSVELLTVKLDSELEKLQKMKAFDFEA